MVSRLSSRITDSLDKVDTIVYVNMMVIVNENIPYMARSHQRISEGESASSAKNSNDEDRIRNFITSHVKLRMLNGLYARAICFLIIFLKTTSLANLLMTLSSSLNSTCAFSRSKVFWKLSSPRIERFMKTVMALIIKANIGLIMRIVSFIYSPVVCDVITIDLRY